MTTTTRVVEAGTPAEKADLKNRHVRVREVTSPKADVVTVDGVQVWPALPAEPEQAGATGEELED